MSNRKQPQGESIGRKPKPSPAPPPMRRPDLGAPENRAAMMYVAAMIRDLERLGPSSFEAVAAMVERLAGFPEELIGRGQGLGRARGLRELHQEADLLNALWNEAVRCDSDHELAEDVLRDFVRDYGKRALEGPGAGTVLKSPAHATENPDTGDPEPREVLEENEFVPLAPEVFEDLEDKIAAESLSREIERATMREEP